MNEVENKSKPTGMEVAVIGIAGRFPGAGNVDEFWDNLTKGVESVSFFSDEELEEAGVEPNQYNAPGYVKAQAILEDTEYFDAAFFGYTPKEAELMNPQSRIFHECVWHALEDAGYVSGTYKGSIGLYAGGASSFNWESLALLDGRSLVFGPFAAGNLTDKDYICSRVSYKLNLKGPVFSVQTACSTSLVAIHLACRALLTAECKIALAGGISVSTMQKQGYLYQPGMIFSADGHCRPFDAKADGILAGNGVALVVLKTLKNALADGDRIYAVVKGSGINNDGLRKVGYTAPSVEGQAEVIRVAQRTARVSPESISYIETHGTATALGDTVELEALTLAFNTDKKGFCGIGSVKSNMGHLNNAAGVTGFIKTALALKNR
ncbi:MAG: polyketide synthase, partial [bacterium]|nr:polyketide synthase [bacterium]